MGAELKSAQERAAAAQAAILDRHLAHAFGLACTRIGKVAWPMPSLRRRKPVWNYWWQAHLTDLLVDAALHRPSPGDDVRVNRLLRGIRLRNIGRWTNDYYDDMAWLGLAAERAVRHLGVPRQRAVKVLTDRMLSSWVPQRGGGIPWRTLDLFFNVPANGPAAILVARTGHLDRAVAMCDWMDDYLHDPATGLVIDGIKPTAEAGDDPAEFARESAVFSYCQGVVLGAEVEAHRATGDVRHVERIDKLLDALDRHYLVNGLVPTAGGGDGGLFAGILTRYLTLVATDLRGDGTEEVREHAAATVRRNADAVWVNRTVDDAGRVFFSADWSKPATEPTATGREAEFIAGAVASSQVPERDLSVQLSGWMALEAAVAVELETAEVSGVERSR